MGRAILVGGLIVGTLDALDAVIVFGLRGAAPLRIFQSIAAGVLGRASYQGGITSAALGFGLHYLIAFLIVTAFCVIARIVPALLDHVVVSGIVYGIGVYFVMNYVVIPLSATSRAPFVWMVFINGLAIHAFGVGLPSAIAARAFR
jgi:hypothetical protein